MSTGSLVAELDAEHVVLDSGGVTGLLGNSLRARAWMRVLDDYAGEIVVPAATLAEIITGSSGRDAEVNRVVKRLLPGSRPVPIDEAVARRAGALRSRSGVADVVDALVVAEAIGRRGTVLVLTSDPSDIAALASEQPRIRVSAV